MRASLRRGVTICLLVTATSACFDDVNPEVATTFETLTTSTSEPGPATTTSVTGIETWIPTTLETTSIGFGEVSSASEETGESTSFGAEETAANPSSDGGSPVDGTTLADLDSSSGAWDGSDGTGMASTGDSSLDDAESSSTGWAASAESTETGDADSGSDGEGCRSNAECGLLMMCCYCGRPGASVGVCRPLCLGC